MLSRIAVKMPITTVMVFTGAVMLGIVSYRELKVQLLPDITLPAMGVWVRHDLGPEDMLEKVTKPIEGIAAQLPRVKEVSSWTSSGRCWTMINFEFGTDMRFAVLDMEERLASWRRTLDDRRIQMYVFPFSSESFESEFMHLVLQSDDTGRPISEDVVDRVEQSLKSIQGIAQVEFHGRIYESVRVEFDPDKLKGYGINFGDVVGRVSAAAAEQPDLGRLETATGEVFVRVGDRLRTIEQLKEIPIDSKGVLRLSDVADIYQGGTLDNSIFRVDGRRGMGVELKKESGVNLVQLARTTREHIEQLNKTLPRGYRLVINRDSAEVIEKTLAEMKSLALLGVLLAGLVPLVFLRSLRMAAIIFLSIPISLIATFNFFYACGLSINILTIIGLAIGASILVDNSIVVLENAFRLAQRGAPPLVAGELGAGEVWRALLASTATTIIVFLPILFSEGEIRIFFMEGALTIFSLLIISLIVALTLVPVLTSRALMLAGPGHAGPLRRWFSRHVSRRVAWMWPYRSRASGRARSLFREAYRAILKRALRYRGRTLFIIAALCIFTWVEQSASVKQGQIDREPDYTFLMFFLQYPKGTKLTQADGMVRQVEKRLREHTAIERFWVRFDDGEGRFFLRLKEKKDRPGRPSVEDIRQGLFEFVGNVPGAVLSYYPKMQPMAETAVRIGEGGVIDLRGSDLDVIENMAERVRVALASFPEITESEIVKDDSSQDVEVRLDRERAGLFNVDAQTVARYVAATRSSGTLASIRLEDGDRRTDVVFEMGGPERETVDDIADLPIFSSVVGAVPLSEVASMHHAPAEQYFHRYNRQQTLQVRYYLRPGVEAGALKDRLQRVLRSLPNPGGVAVSPGGADRERAEWERQSGWMGDMSIILVFIVMTMVFEAVWVPLVILASIPLIYLGITWALLLANQPADEMVAFGMLLLIGLVVNAPIVMLDMAQRLRHERHYRRTRALFQACDQRLRPVAMTVLTTVLGLLPLALSQSEGNEWAPLALTVVGGLLSSTLLTLLVIPCLYLVVEDIVGFCSPPFVWVWRWVGLGVRWASLAVGWTLSSGWKVWRWPKWAWRTFVTVLKAAWRTFRFGLRWTWAGLVWAWVLLRWCLSMAWRLARKRPAPEVAPILEVNREMPSPLEQFAGDKGGALSAASNGKRSGPVLPAFERDAAPLAVQNLAVIYPQRTWRDALRVIPSPRYAIGCRPDRGVEALRGVSVEIAPGLFGLLGPNGAGKTTLLRCMAGLLQPSRGTVRVFGAPLRDHTEALSTLVGYLPQYHGLYDAMTLREFLEYFLLLRMRAQGARLDRRQIDRAVASAAEEVHLLDGLDGRLGTFSGGMRQRAGLARVLLGAPPVILVDEPTAGLDPVERVKVRLLLAQLARDRTVVFSTHLVEDLELSCRSVGVIRQGRMLYAGSPSELLRRLRGRLWEVPVQDGEWPEALAARVEERLFRVARPEGLRWRCIASERPDPSALLVEPRLEDAFLNLLHA